MALASDTANGNSIARLAQSEVGNRLLRLLVPEDFAVLAPHLRRVPLQLNSTLANAGDLIQELCFPEGGVIGFADVLENGQRLAVALTGREGFVGWPLVLGNDSWPHEAIVRAEPVTALKITAAQLMPILSANDRIRTILLRYASILTSQMAQTIVSNLVHGVDRRTARWLLLYHDRVAGDEIVITHEEMGVMLGVRRSSITDALHQLEGLGALKGHRGRVVIRDRACLEELAGETYGFAECEYDRLLVSKAVVQEHQQAAI